MDKTNSLKVFYNGLKINGEKKLIKAYMGINGDSVRIYAKTGETLPRDIWEVKNNTDLYTDYFDDDRVTLTSEHPLYKYVLFAAAKHEIRSERKFIETIPAIYRESYKPDIECSQKRIAALEQIENPGQPSADELEQCREIMRKGEEAEKAARKAAEEAEREQRNAAEKSNVEFVEKTLAAFPILSGAPFVTVEWSESAALPEGLKMSLAAAEMIFAELNKRASKAEGYYKTSFKIEFPDVGSYEGRYDIGADDTTLSEHIKSFAAWMSTHDEQGELLDEKCIDIARRRQAKKLCEIAETISSAAM